MTSHSGRGRNIDVARLISDGGLNAFRTSVVALCLAITIVEGFDTQAIAFVAPRIVEDWGLDASRFGAVFAASVAGLMVLARAAPSPRCSASVVPWVRCCCGH